MFRLFFLSVFLLIQTIALNAQEDFLEKKHDTKRQGAAIDLDFVTAKKINSKAKYSVLSAFDPKHHKTVLWFHGFPVGEEITLSVRRVAQINPDNYSLHHKFTILEDGTLLNERKEVKTHFCISSGGYLPGERIHCRLTNADGSFTKDISFIPNPIDVRNSAGQPIIEAELVTIKPTVYHIDVKGLNENEKFVFKSKSGTRITELSETFVDDGVILTYSPELKGKKGGVGTVEIRRQTGKRYTLKFPWGNRLTEFLDKEKVFNSL